MLKCLLQTSKCLQLTSKCLQLTSKWLRLTSKWLRLTSKWLQLTSKWLRLTSKCLQLTNKWLQLTGKWLRLTGKWLQQECSDFWGLFRCLCKSWADKEKPMVPARFTTVFQTLPFSQLALKFLRMGSFAACPTDITTPEASWLQGRP